MLFKCLDDIEDSEHSDGTACSETLIRLMSASSKIEGFSLSQLLWVFRRTSGTTEFALLPQPQMSSVPLGRRLRASQERDLTPPNPALWEHPPVCSLPRLCLGQLGQSMEKDFLVGANPPGLWLPELLHSHISSHWAARSLLKTS